jgi:hypothetical protein
MKTKTTGLFIVIAWLAMIAIAFVTLARAELVNEIYLCLSPVLMRPDRITYGLIVHVLAFAGLGTLFALAYPQRLTLVCAFVIGCAIALEALQTLIQDRHGTVIDVLEKLAGGLAGIALGNVMSRISRQDDRKAEG